MKIAIVSVTKRGAALGQQVRSAYIQEHVVDCYEKVERESGDTAISFSSLKPHIEQLWKDYDRILFIMATGIVVRMIAPFIKHKSEDPAILVMDEGEIIESGTPKEIFTNPQNNITRLLVESHFGQLLDENAWQTTTS